MESGEAGVGGSHLQVTKVLVWSKEGNTGNLQAWELSAIPQIKSTSPSLSMNCFCSSLEEKEVLVKYCMLSTQFPCGFPRPRCSFCPCDLWQSCPQASYPLDQGSLWCYSGSFWSLLLPNCWNLKLLFGNSDSTLCLLSIIFYCNRPGNCYTIWTVLCRNFQSAIFNFAFKKGLANIFLCCCL